MKFLGNEKDINIKTKHPEFTDWKWLDSYDLPNVAVDFKINVYKRLLDEINSLKL